MAECCSSAAERCSKVTKAEDLRYALPMNHALNRTLGLLLAGGLLLSGCSDDLASEEDAERAYLGLDRSVDKAIQLGFDGFNSASSANISPQTTTGDISGTLTINGKVDQGSSDNKTMSLTEQMTAYTDIEGSTYDTSGALPVIDLKLANVPTGTISGTLVGSFSMSGELEGDISLSLAIEGDLQPAAADPMKVERKPGTTRITGTASSEYGDYSVNILR